MNILNAIRHLVQQKVNRYNKAVDNVKSKQASMYFYQLQGIQEAVKIMGFNVELEKDIDELKFEITT